MTPQERKLIDELFDRLASLESGPRDADAVAAIDAGLRRAPGALYPLVQTVLVQDEALQRADARIRELEEELGIAPGQQPQQTGFLDNMRGALFGERQPQGSAFSGSVPSVRQGASGPAASPWNQGALNQGAAPRPAEPAGGGSFLGTAAATAAGVVGGALLMNSVRSLFGGTGNGSGNSQASAFDSGAASGSPWNQSSGGGNLSRDAGLDDIGGSGRTAGRDDGDTSQRTGLFDTAENDIDDFDDDDGGDFDFDDGGDLA